ncbi:MAG: hypothetical protein R3215_11190 [Halomonas sp.]|nr:hypothetical protein [Halomonas sp.]
MTALPLSPLWNHLLSPRALRMARRRRAGERAASLQRRHAALRAGVAR